MKRIDHKHTQSIVSAVLTAALFCGAGPLAISGAAAAERAAVREKNPPGDIPDSQVFIAYTSPLAFSLQVPEGWSRTDRRDGARFADKYNTIHVAMGPVTVVPTVKSVREHEAADLVKAGRAVKIDAVKSVKLRSGPAILIAYSSNSEPNTVTSKQRRLENNRYLIYRSGKLAVIDLSAPLGADNVDQWKLISNSFQWR